MKQKYKCYVVIVAILLKCEIKTSIYDLKYVIIINCILVVS